MKMEATREVIEVKDEGLVSLMGSRVLLMCANYFYEGKLVGVNETCVKLEDPHIVYQTGSWDESGYSDRQSLESKCWYVQTQAIESFGKSHAEG